MSIEYEKNLHTFAEEVRSAMHERGYGGLCIFTSSTHTEFFVDLPKWSCIHKGQMVDGDGWRIQAKKEDMALLESSLHAVLTMRDIATQQAAGLTIASERLLSALKEHGIEVEHTPTFARCEVGLAQ
jgi:hypothetical protein